LCHISEFGSDEQMKKQIEVGKKYSFTIQSIIKQEHRMALGFGDSVKKGKPEAKKAAKKEKEEEKKESA